MQYLSEKVAQAAVLCKVHLDEEVPALLPGAVLTNDIGVRRQRRHSLDLMQAPALQLILKSAHRGLVLAV